MLQFGAAARLMLAGIVSAFALGLAPTPANAIEIICIEASRYKYLYRIFDSDRRRFAQFFGVSEQSLPPPETCRAALIIDRIEAPSRDGSGNNTANDFAKLADAIAVSRGWLSTLYLASPGGASTMGLRMGFLTRAFWLNTHAVDGRSFEYVPDFLGERPGLPATDVPPNLEAGWQAYLHETRAIREVDISRGERGRRCVSACTFIHAAGVHRAGEAYYHRGRRTQRKRRGQDGSGGRSGNPSEPSMSEMVEGLQRQEARILAFYRLMDAGEAAIRARQNTATQTARRARVPAMPRYIEDHLRTACRLPTPSRTSDPPVTSDSKGDSLSQQATIAGQVPNIGPGQGQGGQPPRRRSFGDPQGGPAPPRQPAAPPQRAANGVPAHHCVAAAHERERLRQFAKLCGRECNARELYRDATRRVRALVPDEGDERRANPRGGRGGSGDEPRRRGWREDPRRQLPYANQGPPNFPPPN